MVLILCVGLLLAVSEVLGHARLNSPTAWNPGPSKTSPCGGGAEPALPATTLEIGKPWTFLWEMIAGDGAGVVEFSLSSKGGTTFDFPVFFSSSSIPGDPKVNTITITGTATILPNFMGCTGTNGLCTIQLRSTSNWFACTSVKINNTGVSTAATTVGTTKGPPTACVTATNLNICSSLNGRQIITPPGTYGDAATLRAIDQSVNATRSLNLNNPNVFNTSGAPGCFEAYTRFLCSLSFPLCNTQKIGIVPTTCNTACLNSNFYCNLTVAHQFLYYCSNALYSRLDQDSAGDCPVIYSLASNPSTGASSKPNNATAIAVPIVLILIVALTLFVYRNRIFRKNSSPITAMTTVVVPARPTPPVSASYNVVYEAPAPPQVPQRPVANTVPPPSPPSRPAPQRAR